MRSDVKLNSSSADSHLNLNGQNVKKAPKKKLVFSGHLRSVYNTETSKGMRTVETFLNYFTSIK